VSSGHIVSRPPPWRAAPRRQASIGIVEAERDGWSLRYGAFSVGEHHTWGATAGALGLLGAILGDD
jgi:hypothetical protein